ncbi:hypothetical protein GGX14DRAFT_440784 [Mycena pura]|uniref:Uncharacterized protein n=1 Tax=Mycena pura TaxID=153505 RepID=A0AAD6VNQ3_9AGAR|nr:hypothetical protein GGX14DRAFT_440784 [Mycena pura]
MTDKDEGISNKRAHDAVSPMALIIATDTSPFTAEVGQYRIDGRYRLPELRKVHRWNPDPTLFPVKDDWIWVLPNEIGPNKKTSEMFVRQEYHDLLVAILHSIKVRNNIDTYLFQNSKRSRGEKSEPEVKLEDLYLGDSWALPIIQDGRQILSNLTSPDSKYPNPFEGEGNSFRCETGVVIAGFPGIGKTTCLRYMFHLRAAANLPTIYMSSKRRAIVYKNGCLGNIEAVDLARVFLENMPYSTWALVDSNDNLATIPQTIIDLGFFVVQAASPRRDRMRAALKLDNGGAQICVMEPFTAWELVIAQSLRNDRGNGGKLPPSERQLVEFHERFGGSPRCASGDALQQDEFDKKIDSIKPKPKDLRELIFYSTSVGLREGSIPNETAHLLVSVFPLTNADRRQFRIGPPSHNIYLKLEDQLKITEEVARRELFETCVQANTPGSMSLAGEMLGQHFHDVITPGGMWNLRRLGAEGDKTKALTRTYTVENGICNVALKVDQTMEIVPSDTGSQVPECISVPTQIWGKQRDDEPSKLNVGIYYHPTRRNFPGADSFYILEPGHVLLFQASVKAAPHGLTEEAVDWFEARGITKFTYIFVSPPKCKPQVQLPPAHEDKFKGRMYAVELCL